MTIPGISVTAAATFIAVSDRPQACGAVLASLGAWRGIRVHKTSLNREKVRRLELLAGAGAATGSSSQASDLRKPRAHCREQKLAAKAGIAYRRLMKDWVPRSKKGAGATAGRASLSQPKRQQRGRSQPEPCALVRGHPHPCHGSTKRKGTAHGLDFSSVVLT